LALPCSAEACRPRRKRRTASTRRPFPDCRAQHRFGHHERRIARAGCGERKTAASTGLCGGRAAESGSRWNGGTTYKPVFDAKTCVDWRCRDRSFEFEDRVGRHGRSLDSQQRVGRHGVFKSTDGGENWTNVGLRTASTSPDPGEPSDSNDVLACATDIVERQRRARSLSHDGRRKTWTKALAGGMVRADAP